MDYDNSIAKGDLHFGLSLMSHLGNGNTPISPTSVRTALAMIYEGARGDTAKQLAQVALLPEDSMTRQKEIKSLTDSLNATNVPYTLRCANGIWVAKAFPMDSDFKSALTNNYHAEAQSVNFESNPNGERTKINEWVSGKTEGKIPSLFPLGSMNTATILVLANALYFKAPWANKFNPQYTQKQDFQLSSGETVQVDMMRKGAIDSQTLPKFLYGEFDGVQLAMLPYEGRQLAKMIILPPKGSSVKQLETHMKESHMSFADLSNLLKSEKFSRLEIPKHEVRGDYDLGSPLQAIGIDKMFSSDADLSGIGPGPLFVSKGVHQTYFKTNEEGSEGAAATGFATMRGMDMSRPVEFVANRPFLEAIIDNNTGALIFLNRIENPQ